MKLTANHLKLTNEIFSWQFGSFLLRPLLCWDATYSVIIIMELMRHGNGNHAVSSQAIVGTKLATMLYQTVRKEIRFNLVILLWYLQLTQFCHYRLVHMTAIIHLKECLHCILQSNDTIWKHVQGCPLSVDFPKGSRWYQTWTAQ